MGLEDRIQRIRSSRDAERFTREAGREDRTSEAALVLSDIGRSAAAILQRERIDMFPEMAAVKAPFAGGHTVKVLDGRLWALGVATKAIALSSDGVFHFADIWQCGVNPASNVIRTVAGQGQTGSLLRWATDKARFNDRANQFVRKQDLPGGYCNAQRMEVLGTKPRSLGEYGPPRLYMTDGTLIYWNCYTEEPYEDTVARLLEETLP